MERFENRRKNYYINKQFQRNFIMKFCVLVILGSMISGAIIYLMSKATVTTTFYNSRLTIKSTADFILPAVLLSTAVVIIFIGLATTMVTLFTSHKIAGPLYRIDKDINDIAAGNLKKIFRLRQGDQIKPITVSLNVMSQALRSNIAAIKKLVDELDSTPLSAEAGEKLKRIKEELNKFNT